MGYKTGVCNFCGTGCGNLLRVEGDRILGVFSAPGHPVSRGRLCVRGWHIHELLNTEDRLAYPLARLAGGGFVRVDYRSALDQVVDGLSRYAGEEIAFLASPRSSNEDNYLLAKLSRAALGCNNIGLASDSGHRHCVDVFMQGGCWPAMTGSLADVETAALILVVGSDITRQNPIVGSRIHLAARGGSHLVTISSRSTQIARLSHRHHLVRPGTQGLLLYAMARILVEENLQDRDFIGRYTDGYEVFVRSLEALDMGAVQQATGIGLDDVRETARRIARAPSAMAFFPSGISGLDRETIARLYNLFLAAGKIGREGCGVNPVTGISNLVGSYDVGAAPDLLPGHFRADDPEAARRLSKTWGAEISAAPGRHPAEMLSARPCGLKALVIVDHDEEIVRFTQALRRLDLVVYLGAYANPITEFAHLIVPTTTFAEADGTYTSTERRIQLMGKKLEPSLEVLPLWRICASLAERLGRRWSYGSAAEVMDEIASVVPSYSAVSHAALEHRFGLQWPCDAQHPEGTPRFAPESPRDRLRFVPQAAPSAAPVSTDGYPFLLIPGRANYYWHQNNVMKKTHIPRREYNALLLLYPNGLVEICAEDAARIGVRDKWPVNIVSADGSMRVAARISADVPPGTAYVPYFVQEMIPGFLRAHGAPDFPGEDSVIPVRIEKV
ncbi:MAG: hypothetical protein FJW35_00495 [Acidobacteria bacterium]|nr:hypothetical protein [Acidobacteriota bacterium]